MSGPWGAPVFALRALGIAAVPYDGAVMQPDFLRPPLPNSYWVDPGRLLAGEYPAAASNAEALDRIQRLLDTGIDTFVDLTADGELPPYVNLLPAAVEHHRWPIEDHGLPHDGQFMRDILDTIEDALARGRRVYVHCRAGIGRTGMTVGCYLTRTGLNADQALDRLQHLWVQSARSASWPSVPETDDQYAFVRDWNEPLRRTVFATLTFAQRVQGSMLGLAVGDALANALSAGRIGHSALDPAPWPVDRRLEAGPDTSMTMAVAESLLARGQHDAEDQMARYVAASRNSDWLQKQPEFKRALAAWQWSRKANAGTHDPKNLDAHSIARSLAAAVWRHHDPAAALDLAADVSRTTQQSPVVLDVCRLWTAILIDALHGEPATTMDTPAVAVVRARRLRPELHGLLERRWSELANRRTGALSVSARALQTFEAAPSFVTGMLGILEHSDDSTTAALFGSLAGARYGLDAIPSAWLQSLTVRERCASIAQQLAAD